MNILREGLIATAALMLTLSPFAQTSNVPKWEIGASIGAYLYMGDLTPSAAGSARSLRPGLNLYGARLLNPSFSLRTNLAFTGLKGNDALYDDPEYRQHRNFKFKTPVFEVSELLVWNLFGKNYEDRGLSPYLFAGIGASFLNIKRDWSNFDAEYFGEDSPLPALIAEDAAHKTPRVMLVIPVGFGLRYALSHRLAFNAETNYRFMNTDYLDGFSKAVNPAKGDTYSSISIGAIYRIGKKNLLDCPKAPW
jgi:hypothetical protein